ncbi:MAG: hypothetical protein E7K72_11875 [Roseomonas mucosa]|nr:hypothetical protein [Roseomonas mucosa]
MTASAQVSLRPSCPHCHGEGWTRNRHGEVDACGHCMRRAEEAWRIAKGLPRPPSTGNHLFSPPRRGGSTSQIQRKAA